ncbi:MAG: hypothetical protein EAX87_10730 [Candidatus Thorarchaeota archaeon]|nr:hypothetical protein [Candidatus Thorarchaeota archaeon]
MDELKKICTSCGSEHLAGPYGTREIVWYGVFAHVACEAYVCLVCGHVEHFCIQSDIDKIRRDFKKRQEKQHQEEFFTK